MNLHKFSSVFVTFAVFSVIHGWILPKNKANTSGVHGLDVTNAIMKATAEDFIVLLVEKKISQGINMAQLGAARGVVVFQMAVDDKGDAFQSGISSMVAKARQVRRTSHNLLVLVESDDAAFLSAFARWTLKGRLLVWATRLLVVTSLRLQRVQFLHKLLSLSNSMLLTPDGDNQKVTVSVVLPYSALRSEPDVVAHWAPRRGLSVVGGHLFPEKFKKITSTTKVYATMIEDATHKPSVVVDPSAPGGQRLVFTGPMIRVLDYVARGLNFSYGFKQSPDGTYGGRRIDGTWTGMVGQVFREEADLGLGPFAMTPVRAEDVDFTSPVKIFGVRILAGQGKLKVDPWGFLLPLTPTVWAVSLSSLLLLPGLMFFLTLLISRYNGRMKDWTDLQYQFLSVFLQEAVKRDNNAWWWERVVLGVWLLTTLVLTRSYEGNLMSLLAVRHVPQPYQSLRAILDDPQAVMIWQKGSSNVELFRTADSGIFREVKEAEQKGRVRLLRVRDFLSVIEEDVVNGRHVIIDFEDNILPVKSQHFSLTGRCSFYLGRETVISQSLGMIGHKTNPLIHFMSIWVLTMNEVGLFDFWYTQAQPNSTSCVSLPSKVTVSASFSLSNSWAMFVVLISGVGVSSLVLLLEILQKLILE